MGLVSPIGRASRSPEAFYETEGIVFAIPYHDEEEGYTIHLSHEDMDSLLRTGFAKMLGNEALSGFDYIINLENPDLPLFAGARSIHVQGQPSSFHSVNMETAIATESHVYEHRGLLLASRHGVNGEWSFTEYNAEPPLRDREVLQHTSH